MDTVIGAGVRENTLCLVDLHLMPHFGLEVSNAIRNVCIDSVFGDTRQFSAFILGMGALDRWCWHGHLVHRIPGSFTGFVQIVLRCETRI